MIYGITEQGFIRKPYSVILQELQGQARLGDYFGSDADLSDASPLGIDIKLEAWAIDRQWALAEEVYYSLWISTSEGVSLDRAVKFGFVSRDPSQYAIVILRFEGEEGSAIAIGKQAETAQNIVFETIEEKTIDSSLFADVYAQCMQVGTIGNVPANSINSIKTPIPGVTSVNNTAAASGGRPQESDQEVRSKYEDLPASTGSSIDAIRAAVAAVPGITNVLALENTDNVDDENGIPPRAFEVIVNGGLDEDIADAIFLKKSAGIESYGTETVVITDVQGFFHDVHFSRAILVDVYVIFEIETNDNWSSANITTMKRNAVSYVGGIDDQSAEHAGVGCGGTVFAWKLIAIQSLITGIEDISVKLGKSPNPTESENLTFLARELPRIEMTNIVVNII
ncbi:MAG: baseplate J/gp47 family protein [Spirochaetes bacterium]|nr:baseplate J/gp47 family protein [Spirochaetota bacterium]